ncbi:MAG: Long-chain fatty acid transport protein [Myxococcales bacterium]|nr:Long-chain fatty acid transport protein [Myxococcales bacterium]
MSLARAVAVAVAAAVAGTVMLAVAPANAAGLERAEQSPEGVAAAGAQTADAEAPAAAYYNPAALAFQRGFTLQGGAVVTLAHATVTPASSGLPLASDTTFATPSLYVTQRVAARFAVGVGLFDPFGASTQYPRAGLVGGVGLELRALAVNPSVAIRPVPWLAVGFGIAVMPVTFEYVTAAADGSNALLSLRGTGIGGNAGVLVRALPRWLDVGVSYRSAIDVELSSSAGKATLPLPHTFSFGAASHPLPGLAITTDVRLTLWQELTSIRFVPNGPMPTDLVTLNWQNSIGVRAGAAYGLLADDRGQPRLVVRIGGGWDQAPTSPAAVDPAFADGDRILVSAGAGARLGWVSLDAGYLVAVVRPYLGASGSQVARYQSLTHTVAVALTFRLPELGYRVDEIAFKR